MDLTCVECGDDTATLALCSDCVVPTPARLAAALGVVLGGDDWADVAEQLHAALL